MRSMLSSAKPEFDTSDGGEPVVTEFDFDSWEARLIAMELANDVGKGILKALTEEPATASQIARSLGIPLPTVMFHLSRLEVSGIVETKTGFGKQLREVKYYYVPANEIVFRIGGSKTEEKSDEPDNSEAQGGD